MAKEHNNEPSKLKHIYNEINQDEKVLDCIKELEKTIKELLPEY